MSLQTKHPQYEKMTSVWEAIRDFYAGPDVVRAAGEKYLMPTAGMREDGMGPYGEGRKDYEAYKARAHVPDYIKEAVEALVGLLHQKEATIRLPTKMEYLRHVATPDGEPLSALHRRISVEQITTGRVALLVDLPAAEGNALPYMALYPAESVVNWDSSAQPSQFGRTKMVVLNESGLVRDGPFGWRTLEAYRVLQVGALDDSIDDDGVYRTGRFDADRGLVYSTQSMITPMFQGAGLSFIPFVFINTKDLLPELDEPPLKGLMELCKGIYQSEADYRQNLYMQSQETLVVIGGVKGTSSIPGAPDVLRTGAGARIDLDQNGDAKYIGVSANGLQEQRTAVENDRRRAEIKSGELIQNKGSQMESGQALSTRFNAQTATLNQLATTAAAGLQTALRQIAVWIGANPDEVEVVPNTEFIDFAIAGAEFKSIMEAKNLGFPISYESLHALAADRGITVKDFKTELALIQSEQKLGLAPEKTPANPDGGKQG